MENCDLVDVRAYKNKYDCQLIFFHFFSLFVVVSLQLLFVCMFFFVVGFVIVFLQYVQQKCELF